MNSVFFLVSQNGMRKILRRPKKVISVASYDYFVSCAESKSLADWVSGLNNDCDLNNKLTLRNMKATID